MNDETAAFLVKSHKLLNDARLMGGLRLGDAIGRNAYLAAFHAAQGLIHAHNGSTAKTHNGVHTEFHRIVNGDTRVDLEMRGFLSRSYNLKSIADYETGLGSEVSYESAVDALRKAETFVALIESIVAQDFD